MPATAHTLHPQIVTWFTEYDATHGHPMNRVTHKIAIPAIVFHIVAMLSWIPLGTVGDVALNGGHVAVLLTTAFYMRYNPIYGVLMAVFGSCCVALAGQLDAQLGTSVARATIVGIAVGGWIVQLAGHAVWEKKSPAFLRNLVQALVGPIYFIALLMGHWQPATWQPNTATTTV
jgi:uncharacterized membrane protein YGL010W